MKKIGIVYGGMSTEHDVSIMSAKSVMENLDKGKYEIYPIYIDKQGNWHKKTKDEQEKIENIAQYLQALDVIFPVLHGKNGEDGTIQ